MDHVSGCVLSLEVTSLEHVGPENISVHSSLTQSLQSILARSRGTQVSQKSTYSAETCQASRLARARSWNFLMHDPADRSTGDDSAILESFQTFQKALRVVSGKMEAVENMQGIDVQQP